LRGQPETIQTTDTRDGGEVELRPRFETKAPYWVEPTISTEDRIAERDIGAALDPDATPPQVWFKHEWHDFDRKDALLFTSTKDLTPDQHQAAIYKRRVATAREAAEQAEKGALYDSLLANVKRAAHAERSAEETPQTS
jgi:non-ribosomal peptide synthetase component F